MSCKLFGLLPLRVAPLPRAVAAPSGVSGGRTSSSSQTLGMESGQEVRPEAVEKVVAAEQPPVDWQQRHACLKVVR